MPNIQKLVSGVILTIVAIIVIFTMVGNTAGSVEAAADNISGSGLPLAGLFASNGVVTLIYMAGIMLGIIGLALGISAFKS